MKNKEMSMSFASINPATGETLARFEHLSDAALEQQLANSAVAQASWQDLSFAERGALLHRVGDLLTERREALAQLAHLEMGKLLPEALGEVDKCADACHFYADNSEGMLQDQQVDTHAKDSRVIYQAMGSVFAIMPWNFPFWQVVRCMAPNLMAGNALLLKHAPNVPQCAAALADILTAAGAPEGLFSNLFISVEQAAQVIADDRVHGVAFTGSEAAGRKIGALAGANLKKVVLELGGSDPLIVLADADVDAAVEVAVRSRFSNAGQICIASKRFIVEQPVADEFVAKLQAKVSELNLAPMARADLRDQLAGQVERCKADGASLLCGGQSVDGAGYYYQPTVFDQVKTSMASFSEEIFGPVAAVIRVADADEAVAVANDTRFGLGASLWTADLEKGQALARRLEVGACFINAQVASDVRLPFGGIKASGVGRELGVEGIREFCNAKTVWTA